jgi:6-phosphogluconolactonase (cycloisomerase 2 family)/uncharacterized Zn-binding protein involved in type VI secretion
MPGICRDTTDSAGGALIKSQTTVLANGKEVIVHGDSITSHGDSPHDSPTMIASDTSSDNVFIGGVAVCNAGDLATCSHKASGSGNVNVNSPGPSVSSDISVAALVRTSTHPGSSTDNDVRDVKFNNDGTKVFVLGRDNDNVYEYLVSTPFDVSTMSAVVQTLDISVVSSTQGDNAANGIDFNTDGTKLFVLGQGQDLVNEYALSTGFDLSTASFTQSLDISSEEDLPYGVTFNNDGTKMYITGRRQDDIDEYVLTTGFDISTASPSQTFSVSSQAVRASAVRFNSDGTFMYILEGGTDGEGHNTIYQYTLTTAFDVSTASYSEKSFSVLFEEDKARGFCFGDNYTKLYVAGWRGDDINQYTTADTIVGS